MRPLRSVLPLLLILSLSACAALGQPTPKGFDQQLAEAYSVHTAVTQATTVALTAGSISVNDVTAVKGLVLNSRQLLDSALAAETAGNTAGASSELALALSALTALQTYLNTHGSTK